MKGNKGVLTAKINFGKKRPSTRNLQCIPRSVSTPLGLSLSYEDLANKYRDTWCGAGNVSVHFHLQIMMCTFNHLSLISLHFRLSKNRFADRKIVPLFRQKQKRKRKQEIGNSLMQMRSFGGISLYFPGNLHLSKSTKIDASPRRHLFLFFALPNCRDLLPSVPPLLFSTSNWRRGREGEKRNIRSLVLRTSSVEAKMLCGGRGRRSARKSNMTDQDVCRAGFHHMFRFICTNSKPLGSFCVHGATKGSKLIYLFIGKSRAQVTREWGHCSRYSGKRVGRRDRGETRSILSFPPAFSFPPSCASGEARGGILLHRLAKKGTW